ncbi:MAG: DoxX family membrane protein [Abditibacteriales bacterium]|nr:DoxX family membrane protein [Abditibacteriales bacterium]MDW8364714.1 MauE/DoxX family redox-associated membrane protein [Abditibacteriales bacterium]
MDPKRLTILDQSVGRGEPLPAAPSAVPRFLTSPYLSVVLRAIVGAMFITAGWGKTGTNFEGVLMEYKLLPLALVPTVAKVLPYVELLIGVCFFAGLFTRLSCVSMMGLLLIFIGAISIAWAQGKTHLDCGCNPMLAKLGLQEKVGPLPIVLDTLMFLSALQVFLYDRRLLSLDGWLTKNET